MQKALIKNQILKYLKNKETIFWVDENIKNQENQQYCDEIYNEYTINFTEFVDLNSIFEEMKLIKFEIVFIIISGKLIEDYLKLFKKQIDLLYIIPIHIIFTSHKNIIINLLKEKYSEDLNNYLINIENIASSFDEVKNILNKYFKDVPSKIKLGNLKKPKDYNYCFNFEYIEKSEQLIFPFLYEKIMENAKVSNLEIKKFNQFLLQNFGSNKEIKELINKLIKVGNIPNEIIAKC